MSSRGTAWTSTQPHYLHDSTPQSYAEGAWLAAKVFTDPARKQGANLTRASLFQALNGMSNYTTGFTVPITMSSDHGPNHQVTWGKWNGHGFAFGGWQPW